MEDERREGDRRVRPRLPHEPVLRWVAVIPMMMAPGTRDLLRWMADREAKARARLQRRASYGGRKGRAAARRLRRMGAPVWGDPERIISGLYGPEWARLPHGFAGSE